MVAAHDSVNHLVCPMPNHRSKVWLQSWSFSHGLQCHYVWVGAAGVEGFIDLCETVFSIWCLWTVTPPPPKSGIQNWPYLKDCCYKNKSFESYKIRPAYLYFALNINILPLAYIKRNNNKYKSLTCPIELKSASIAVLFLFNKAVHSKSLSKISFLYLYLDSNSIPWILYVWYISHVSNHPMDSVSFILYILYYSNSLL